MLQVKVFVSYTFSRLRDQPFPFKVDVSVHLSLIIFYQLLTSIYLFTGHEFMFLIFS